MNHLYQAIMTIYHLPEPIASISRVILNRSNQILRVVCTKAASMSHTRIESNRQVHVSQVKY